MGLNENTELPAPLLRLISAAIPTYLAAEVLLFLVSHSNRELKPEEIVAEMQPVVITLPAVKEYLALFCQRNIVMESNGCFRYGPSSVELEHEVGALAKAYNERPVTLIHTIYRIAESRIQSFADSFKFKREPE